MSTTAVPVPFHGTPKQPPGEHPAPRIVEVSDFLAILIGYLLGSIDFGVIVPKLMGVDIYEHGSGNPGTSNVFRSVGKGAAGVVMAGDAIKGLAAAAIGSALGGVEVGFAAGLAAVVGHAFPIWHRFRGGRGVATAIGALAWLAPIYGIVLAVAWGATVAVTKTASIASLGAMALYVPAAALDGHRGVRLLIAGGIALLVVARHSANIKRLLTGQERKVVGE